MKRKHEKDVEEEARLKAAEDARLKAEEEAKLKAAAEAMRQDEEDARQQTAEESMPHLTQHNSHHNKHDKAESDQYEGRVQSSQCHLPSRSARSTSHRNQDRFFFGQATRSLAHSWQVMVHSALYD